MADASRRETWCFQRTNKVNGAGKECMQLLPFKFVEYDGNPDRYLEPVNMRPFETGPMHNALPVNAVNDGTVVAGFEVFDSVSTIWEGVHEFHFC